MNNLNINNLKLELLLNEVALKSSSLEEKEPLLTQRAMLKDLIIEVLQDQIEQLNNLNIRGA